VAIAVIVDAVADLKGAWVNSGVVVVAVSAEQPRLVTCPVAGGVSVPVIVGAGYLSLRRQFESDQYCYNR
jgi:hypothetical protein